MSWTAERARVASLTRSRTPDDPDLLNARRQLKAERLADYIRRTVEAAPPLTTEQRDRLALLLRSGAPPGGVTAYAAPGGNASPAGRSDSGSRPGADAA